MTHVIQDGGTSHTNSNLMQVIRTIDTKKHILADVTQGLKGLQQWPAAQEPEVSLQSESKVLY